MQPSVAGGEGDVDVRRKSLLKPGKQIGWQEGHVTGQGQDPVGSGLRGPGQRREQACQRSIDPGFVEHHCSSETFNLSGAARDHDARRSRAAHAGQGVIQKAGSSQ